MSSNARDAGEGFFSYCSGCGRRRTPDGCNTECIVATCQACGSDQIAACPDTDCPAVTKFASPKRAVLARIIARRKAQGR